MTPDDVAFARARLKSGASDAEVRLELLSRALTAEAIDAVMRAATPRVQLNPPYLVVGFGLCALAMGLLATRAASMNADDVGTFKWLAAVAALGVAFAIRGFTRRS